VTTQQITELMLAVVLLALGVWRYRRKRPGDSAQYGSQSAVLLFAVAVLLAIHALGLLEYRPSAAELGQ
jgi:hypothetical protein